MFFYIRLVLPLTRLKMLYFLKILLWLVENKTIFLFQLNDKTKKNVAVEKKSFFFNKWEKNFGVKFFGDSDFLSYFSVFVPRSGLLLFFLLFLFFLLLVFITLKIKIRNMVIKIIKWVRFKLFQRFQFGKCVCLFFAVWRTISI